MSPIFWIIIIILIALEITAIVFFIKDVIHLRSDSCVRKGIDEDNIKRMEECTKIGKRLNWIIFSIFVGIFVIPITFGVFYKPY